MASEELLQEFMLDYDDVCNFEKSPKSIKIIWRELIRDKEIWQKLQKYWHNNNHFIEFLISLNKADSELYFRFAIECMIAFLQENFTGPTPAKPICRPLLRYKADEKYFKTALSVNSEELHPMTVHPILLFVAKQIFKFCNFYNPIIRWWWQLRAIMIHQKVLQELTQSLFTEAENLRNRLIDLPIVRRWRALLEIEQAQLFIHFRNVTLAQKHLDKAGALLGIVYEIRDEVTPLTIDENSFCPGYPFLLVYFCDDESIARPPINVRLRGPTDHRCFVELPEIQEARRQLPDLEQKFLLAVLQKTVLSHDCEDNSIDIAEPFVNGLLNQNNTWAVRSQLLWCWCAFTINYFEELKKDDDPDRYIRILKPAEVQAKEISDNMQQNSPCVLNRIGGVFACNLIPCWKRKEIIADIKRLCRKGNAIEMYAKVQCWSQATKSYRITNESYELSNHIRNRMEQEKDETVALWCWLGDVENDVTYYEKAWELSEQTSSQVQRHLGNYYYFVNKEFKLFEQCLPHFAKSLEINPLQADIWYRYGYACCECSKWEAAIKALQHLTCLEPQQVRAWCYLAYAQGKFGNKVAAYDAYERVLKNKIVFNTCGDIWYNFMVLCIYFGKYSQGFRAYQRVAEFRKDALFNVKALKYIVKGMQHNVAAVGSRRAHQDLDRVSTYISETAVNNRGSGFLSAIHALVAPKPQIKITRLISAVRAFVNDLSWSEYINSKVEVLQVCLELAEKVADKSVAEPFVPEIKERITTIMKQIDRKVDGNFEYFFKKLEDLLKIGIQWEQLRWRAV